MTKEKSYEELLKMYSEKYNIPPYLIDFMACEEVILASINGASNEEIAKDYEDDIEYVKNILRYFIGFDGNDTPLNFSPYFVYKATERVFDVFNEVLSKQNNLDIITIGNYWRMCKCYEDLRKELDKAYYGESS